jgi:hypothetical protein
MSRKTIELMIMGERDVDRTGRYLKIWELLIVLIARNNNIVESETMAGMIRLIGDFIFRGFSRLSMCSSGI